MQESGNTAASNRSIALDALRGFAIITMILSSRIPYGILPRWMYHIQVPPPFHKFTPTLPGISWVDLVFPFFLFSMGAAFPFAINSRMQKSSSIWFVSFDILKRGVLLMLFAIIIMHVRPHSIDPHLGISSLLIGLVLFACMFLLFWRYPDNIKKKQRMGLQTIGAVGLLLFFYFVKYPNGTGFSFQRFDIIILVLSNVAIAGSFIYLLCRNNSNYFFYILIALIGVRVSFGIENSWVHTAGMLYPPWMLFQLTFLKYLFIIIPGIITGITLYENRKRQIVVQSITTKEKISFAFVTIILMVIILFSLIGLYSRMVLLLFLTAIPLLVILCFLLKELSKEYAHYLLSLLLPGVLWYCTGLLFESFEGGIKKDPSTLSYYFVTSGLAIFLLLVFMIATEVFSVRKGINLLALNGQNPMLAYAGGTNLLTPIVMITYLSQGLDSLCIGYPWLGAVKGICITLLLAFAVSWFTRKKIFWRT